MDHQVSRVRVRAGLTVPYRNRAVLTDRTRPWLGCQGGLNGAGLRAGLGWLQGGAGLRARLDQNRGFFFFFFWGQWVGAGSGPGAFPGLVVRVGRVRGVAQRGQAGSGLDQAGSDWTESVKLTNFFFFFFWDWSGLNSGTRPDQGGLLVRLFFQVRNRFFFFFFF